MNKTVGTRSLSGAESFEPASRSALFTLNFKPLAGESVAAFCARIGRELAVRAAEPLHVLAFGSVQAAPAFASALAEALGACPCPMTWAEGGACDGGAVAGVQVFAVSGASVERIIAGDRVVGSVFSEGGCRQCVVGGLVAPRDGGSRAAAARRTLELLESALAQAGFGLADVVRTWFFLDDLLAWYEAFNRVRAEVYARTAFRAGCLPASTGVAARNPAGAPLSVAAWALQPLDGATRVVEVPSPLQGPARAYGSWFSRAVEVIGGDSAAGETGARRRLWISGTASIAPDGRTLYPGRARLQIEHTLRVIEAILESRGYGFGHVTRAVAYFKSAADAALFGAWQECRELRRLPVVQTVCGICRGELEFEVEVDAAR
jgi:enamine deaminase RidA (YjgF/YER057c/UK114 family)